MALFAIPEPEEAFFMEALEDLQLFLRAAKGATRSHRPESVSLQENDIVFLMIVTLEK